MKWHNLDVGEGYYYITGTVVEWLRLLERDDVRNAVVHEIKIAMGRYRASLAAYVIMPDHIHMLAYLPSRQSLHAFCKCWRGRSARKMIDLLVRQGDTDALRVMARNADHRCKYAAWKEQPRSIPIYTEAKLRQKIDYIHANPVKRGLVDEPAQWPYSSWRFYEDGRQGILPVTPPEL